VYCYSWAFVLTFAFELLLYAIKDTQGLSAPELALLVAVVISCLHFVKHEHRLPIMTLRSVGIFLLSVWLYAQCIKLVPLLFVLASPLRWIFVRLFGTDWKS
jgi:hypothetical protein